MKIALINDTHAGKRSDNVNVLDHQELFFKNVFFPYLKSNSIDTIFHLGDVFDRRKYINFNTLKRARDDFLTPLARWGHRVVILAGNHDTYYKDNNHLNSLTTLLNDYPNFEIFIDPFEYNLNGTKIALIPWICRENQKRSFDFLKKTKAEICFGHLHLQGFEMHKGSYAEEGMDKSIFEKFSVVCSGHFHHKSTYDNIHYLGSPYQMDWGDYGDTKGFHVFDTETHDITFIPNPYSLFHKVEYDDKGLTESKKLMEFDFEVLKKSFVRVSVKNKDNSFWFDSFMEKIEAQEPLSVQIIEDMGNLAFDGEENELIHVEDTIALLSKYCNQIGVSENLKPKLNELLQSLYNQADNMRM